MLNAFFNVKGSSSVTVVRVFGIGSPFGDDQLGWEVIKLLQQRERLCHLLSKGLTLMWADRPGLRLLEWMRGVNTMILIDAVKTGAAVGTCYRFLQDECSMLSNGLSTHGIGLAEAIDIARALHELPEKLIIYGMEIAEVEGNFHLTAPVTQALLPLAIRVEQEIMDLFNE